MIEHCDYCKCLEEVDNPILKVNHKLVCHECIKDALALLDDVKNGGR